MIYLNPHENFNELVIEKAGWQLSWYISTTTPFEDEVAFRQGWYATHAATGKVIYLRFVSADSQGSFDEAAHNLLSHIAERREHKDEE